MSLERLSIRGVRNLEDAKLFPAAGINWFSGPNGAGKTSVIEAIYLLARGRSFRSARIASLIHYQDRALTVAARTRGGHVLGVERDAEGWRGRIDGRDCQRISEFAALLPMVLIEPGSHALIDGGPDRRRQFLDWQLFHVEHDYLKTWQRYARLLRQRNAALKAGASDAVLSALEPGFVDSAQQISQARSALLERLSERVLRLQAELGFRIPGPLELRYRPGFPENEDFVALLEAQRQRDRELGYARHGPHRAELVLSVAGEPAVQMSRGQQKLLAVLLLLAQLRLLTDQQSGSPLLLLDDPVSELDQDHLERLLAWVSKEPVQSWVTATTPAPLPARMFHVEQGRIQPVV